MALSMPRRSALRTLPKVFDLSVTRDFHTSAKRNSSFLRGSTTSAVQQRPSQPTFQHRMVQGVSIVEGCIVNTNPATGEEISRILCTTPEELDNLIESAKEAQVSWSQMSPAGRIQLLQQGLRTLAQKSDVLIPLIVKEMGKPFAEAREEVEGAVDRDEFFAILQKALEPQKRGPSCRVVRQPLGVVGVLSPWNFPADEILLLVLPALASGNAVVVKPSEVTPDTGALVVRSLALALPPGVLQLAQGDGAVGAQLVAHKDISMIAMTGSSATGRKILQSAAPQLKRLVLELGGKDPVVVFGDADLDKAAEDAVAFSLSNTGQVCCSFERVFVDQSIYDDFCERVAAAAASYIVGNGMDPGVKVGPLVSPMQRDIVQKQVDDAVSKGASLVFQSSLPEAAAAGNFYPVTVLSNVQEGMDIYRQETFGPVVALTPFDGSEEEAIRLANDTEYGLSSSVYTTDLDKAQRVANAIEAGQVGINCYALENMDVGCPWAGHKQSGYGYHSGPEGFQQFSVPKSLVFSAPLNNES